MSREDAMPSITILPEAAPTALGLAILKAQAKKVRS